MTRWLRRHSLSIAILVALAIMLSATLLLGPGQYMADRQTDNLAGFWQWWVFETVLSLEADVWGAFLLVFLTKFLWEAHSAEAKDPPEERHD